MIADLLVMIITIIAGAFGIQFFLFKRDKKRDDQAQAEVISLIDAKKTEVKNETQTLSDQALHDAIKRDIADDNK